LKPSRSPIRVRLPSRGSEPDLPAMCAHTPGFVAIEPAVLQKLEALVGRDQVVTTVAEVETMSKDCYWYSPVLKDRLDPRRAAAVVKARSLEVLRGVLSLAYHNDLPVTVLRGSRGRHHRNGPDPLH